MLLSLSLAGFRGNRVSADPSCNRINTSSKRVAGLILNTFDIFEHIIVYFNRYSKSIDFFFCHVLPQPAETADLSAGCLRINRLTLHVYNFSHVHSKTILLVNRNAIKLPFKRSTGLLLTKKGFIHFLR